ncbi:MAG: hypothetical protein EHM39_05965 [Chloroflexi bacterium]|nr:MAG: hypothetical protein EHM39_05965 [Chloroflexota bacterium]
MGRRDEYDPGNLDDPRPRRRGRRFEDEYDDAWAGGEEDADWDDPAGSLWENPRQAARDEADEDVSPITPRRRRYRSRRLSSNYYDNPATRPDRARRDRYDSEANNSPTYYRDRAHRGEYGEFYEKPKRDLREPSGLPGPLANIPFWQILMLVILGLMAFLAVMLACVSLLTL